MLLSHRDPKTASQENYDLLIVGGGIYGICLSLEASRRGLKSLLLEKGDFGRATSWNSFKIIHGGLRYLQSLDFHRFRESVAERKWFLTNFPDLVEPLECLMPLYNRGLHRTALFRVALLLNAALSFNRNRGVRSDRILKNGHILSFEDTISAFPDVDRTGLRGAAIWYDAAMIDSQRIIEELLRWALTFGARALNYMEVTKLNVNGKKVLGLQAQDQKTKNVVDFQASTVVNCAGPWCRELAGIMHRDIPELFFPSLAYNLLLNRDPISMMAIAVTPKYPNAKTYFLRPYNNKIFAGTYHAPQINKDYRSKTTESDIERFLNDLNSAVPALQLTQKDISQIYSGLLPAKREGSTELAVREKIINHEHLDGPIGFFSVSGVKFTTARLVAEKTLSKIFKDNGIPPYQPNTERPHE